MEDNDFKASLGYLYNLQRFGMIFGLSNIENIAQTLGNPQKNLKVVHIGGTNGKGSTAAMMASVLQQSGYRVGLYTSPHVVSFTERIQINNQEITESEVARLTARIRKRVEKAGIPQEFTFFDFTTAMAFLYFSESHVDLALIEVGLGGRLDSTNIVSPLVSVITNVSHEHRDVLGDSLIEIAREKAGIIKKRVPLVTGIEQEEILLEIERMCRERSVPLYRKGRDFTGDREGAGRFRFTGRRWSLSGVEMSLLGDHQIENATMALGTLETMEDLGFMVNRESIRRGLGQVHWPGRLEIVHQRPWVVLDGAHNPSGAKALRAGLSQHFASGRHYFLLGIMKDKEVEEIVSILVPLSAEIVVCTPGQVRAASPDRLMRAVEAAGSKGRVIPDVGAGLDALLSMVGRDDLICVTGSFYTIGEARRHLSAGSCRNPVSWHRGEPRARR
jgi:dihydrofolate synthase/folylpolyglutamate synthase